MANAVRKICTKIGNSHQYLIGATAKTSVYGGHLVSSDAAVQQHSAILQQVDTVRRLNYSADTASRRPLHPLYSVGQCVRNQQSVAAAVEWFNALDNRRDANSNNPITSSTRSNSTVTEPDVSSKSNSPKEKGLPSADQLDFVYNRLGDDLPLLFKQNLDYSLYHPKLAFENNIRGTKTVGLEYFMTLISILRLMGHLKYAYVKFDILKITKHPDDGTIKVRWRIKGISGMKVFFKFWKFRLWNLEQVIKENIESWHDGFSVFYLGSDGKIHKLTADKMLPDNDPVIEDKNPLATKLALFLGLSPQLNNLDCLMTMDPEQTGELLKMVIMSLEDVI